MLRGRWNERSGETIKFDDTGTLIDGQHRLRAIIRHGKALWFLVAYNCSRESFKVIDTGAVRSGADVLSIEQKDGKNFNILAATLTLIDRAGMGFTQTTITPSNDMIIELAKSHPDLPKSISFVLTHKGPKGFLSPSIMAYMHYTIARNHGYEWADKYALGILEGEAAKGDQPLRRMRSRLIDNLASQSKIKRLTVLALLVKTWNAFYEGRQLGMSGLRWRGYAIRDENGKAKAGHAVESFPKML